MNIAKSLTFVVASTFAFASMAFGQAGVSSMSSSALRSGMILSHEQIRVEELVNFHRHQIALPAWDQRVGVEVRTGTIGGKNVFQIGLATHRDIVEEFRVPLNLVLVIDRSGSMSGNRIEKVKEALIALSKKLAPDDLVSIVTYSSDASVCLEGTRAKNCEAIESAINRIKTGGSTNLNAGLMLGYKLAQQSFDKKRSNRVILLTDGIANRGTTDPETIAKASKGFNDEGIGLSTIGLGTNFNQVLLRDLADAGRGAIHFIADAKDIRKVFVDEFDSLLSPSASDLTLTIRVPKGERLPKIFGYEPVKQGSSYQIPLENMSYGATQIVVGKWNSKSKASLQIELAYKDVCVDKKVTKTMTIECGQSEPADRVLKKNFTIAKVAQSIRQSAKLAESNQYSKASKRLKASLEFARSSLDDSDVSRVYQIAAKQLERIQSVASLR